MRWMPHCFRDFRRNAGRRNVDKAPPKLSPKWLVRGLLPVTWLRQRAIYLRLGNPAGSIYAGLRLRERLGMKLRLSHTLSPHTRSVLCVCYGNIMRSPMAAEMMKREILARNIAPPIAVQSAGLHAQPANPAHPWALAAGQAMGIPLTEHRAQLMSDELAAQADAIFAMDFQNAAELLARFPQARDKIHMLGHWRREPGTSVEISDPYYTDVEGTKQCYEVIQRCVRNIVDELEKAK